MYIYTCTPLPWPVRSIFVHLVFFAVTHSCPLSDLSPLLGQIGCHDHPAVQDLLPSLPLSTLLLQSFQLEPALPTPHSPSIVSLPPLSSLTRTLTAAPLQQSWLASLRVKGRDDEVEPLWCARVMLALLLRLYRTRNVRYNVNHRVL